MWVGKFTNWPKCCLDGQVKVIMSCIDATEFARVNSVICSIEDDTDWDIAETSEKLYFYQLRAAQNVGIFEPFTEEQDSLMAYLTQRMAGRRLCDYAWRVFAQSA